MKFIFFISLFYIINKIHNQFFVKLLNKNRKQIKINQQKMKYTSKCNNKTQNIHKHYILTNNK